MESKLRSDSQCQANLHSCKLLLNCYIRELVQEFGELILMNADTMEYAVLFKASGVTVYGKLSYYSDTGEHEYHSMRWSSKEKIDGLVEYRDLVRWIIREVSGVAEIRKEKAQSFAERVDNSNRNLALFLEQADELEISDYRTSEQALIYGHPFHPFPKNSLGFSEMDVRMYSPELRTSFQLKYFAVRRDMYQEEWVSDEKKVLLQESLNVQLRDRLGDRSSEYALLPVHPWQYNHVLELAAVQEYVREGKLIPLGSLGPLAYPTTSVRTVFLPEMNCNIKLPLNMQITNMVRNNSDIQMRRTLDASRYLLQQDGFGPESPTRIAYETGFTTCRFEEEELTRLFTIAYRPIEYDTNCTFVLASLVEAPVPGKPSRLISMLKADITHIERWFERYLDLSLLPIVRIAWEKGIHFEAHLQNTLLSIREGMPTAFIIRDLEGVSVEIEKKSGELSSSSPLFYPREEAWARTSYYFIVNHLGSLIHTIARDVRVMEEHFWRIVHEVLMQEYLRSGNAYVKYLLTSDVFHAKRNMMSCLWGISETPAYVPVRNMIKKVGSETSGNHRLFV
ncbi:IucA/IucC family protein [Paenibacillus puldeungensis]|uniref:IucA/IucC family protein n=1 Tax=Paenibacillus puldeungensis TaxID=696536 RepID=A0ABW3RU30_9BACL